MTFEKAKREFQIRCYYWATSEFEKEINESFPNLRLFKNGPSWQLYRFMQQIDKVEQLILSHSLLKRYHPDAVQILGESSSDEEILLLKRLDDFRSKYYGFDVGVARIGPSGEKIKFATKNKLRKIIVAKFIDAYGKRCVKIQTGEEWDPWFEMKCAGWTVITRFTFGRRESILDYDHSIESEAKTPNPPFPTEFWLPSMRLECHISFAKWLGIGGTRWEYILPEEVEPACDTVIKFSRYVFDALPKLLKGLEFEKITLE